MGHCGMVDRHVDSMHRPVRGLIPLPEGDVPETTQCITICIPSGAAYKRQLFGLLYETTHWNAYERDATHKGTLVAQAWRAAIVQGMLNCYQFKIIDGIPAFSNDGGETWTPVPAVNDGSSGYDPRADAPLNPHRTGTNIPCLAAANATACFVELHREIVAWYDDAMTVVIFCAVISAMLQVFFGVGWMSFQMTVNYMTYVTAILGYSSALNNAAFTSTIQDELTCIFNCRANEDGQWSASSFQDVLNDIALKTGDMWRLIEIYVESIGGYVGLNNAGTTTSVATHDCTGCGCGWCRDSDFALGSDGWSVYSNASFNPAAQAVWSGTRWDGRVVRSVPYPANYWTQCSIVRGAMTGVTRIEVWFEYDDGNNTDTAFPRLVLADEGGAGVFQNWVHPATGYAIWTGTPRDINDLRIRLEAAHRTDSTPTTGYAYITRIKIQGTGANPLGGDNCT